MLRLTLSPLVLIALLAGANACAGSHKHAEVPDFTEKGWSPPSNESAQAKADPPIQSSPSPAGDASSAPQVDKAAVPAASAPPSTGTDADVVSGTALPPAPKATKPGKGKKGKRKGKPT